MSHLLNARRRRFAAALALAPCGAVFGQAFPSRALRIVVPWAPGGGLVDTGARVVAELLTKGLAQAASVENVPGAGGTLGADQVARAAADGHTLLMGTTSIALDVAGGRKLPFDPLRDLAPVSLVGEAPSIVVVAANSSLRTLADLIAAAKARPGELAYGTQGIGSPAHLFTELLAQTAGLQLLHVPYGRSPAIHDLIGGRLALMVGTAPAMLPQVRSGQVRALAVTGRQRLAVLPEVPTVAEAGLAGYEAGQWLGVFAPAATPQAILQRLATEIARGLALPEVVQQLAQRALEVRSGGADALAQALTGDIRKWGQVMRTGNIRLEG